MMGVQGQARLAKARVLVIGAGGLGCPILLYLAAAGVGHLHIVDPDSVDRSNLQRQVLYTEEDEGQPKAQAAALRLRALNGLIQVTPHVQRFDRETALDLARDVDLLIDGTDSFDAKYLANDVALTLGIPLVFGSVLGAEGQVAVVPAKGGPCYRCLYPRPPTGHVPNCAEAGVIGPLAGMVGTIQATEAIKLLADPDGTQARPLTGRLLAIEARFGLETHSLAIPVRPDCPACQAPEGPDLMQLHPPPAPAVGADALDRLAPYRLVDVRTLEEWQQGHIPGAVHLPLAHLQSLAEQGAKTGLAGDRVIAYCAVGVRSARAAQLLRAEGTEAWTLEGGLTAWERAGRP